MGFLREEKRGTIKQPGAGLKLVATSGTMILPGGDFRGAVPPFLYVGVKPFRALGDQSGRGQPGFRERRLFTPGLKSVQDLFSQTFRPTVQGGIIGMVSTQTINKFPEPRTIRVRLDIGPASIFDYRQGKCFAGYDLYRQNAKSSFAIPAAR